MSLVVAVASTADAPAGAPKLAGAKRQLPVPMPMPRRAAPPTKPAVVSTTAATSQTTSLTTSTPTAGGSGHERVLAVPKRRKIALVTDTADALRRVENAEAIKRPAPMAAARETASGFVAPPTQSNGTTPAMRAMRRAETANSAMTLAQYNIVKHFVVLDKLLQQATAGAVVAETALDLARSGRF